MALIELTPTYPSDHWQDDASCNDPLVDPRLFFPFPAGYRPHLPKRNMLDSLLVRDERLRATVALAICQVCPVQDTCLEKALDEREFEGVWGNTVPTERRAILRHRSVVE